MGGIGEVPHEEGCHCCWPRPEPGGVRRWGQPLSRSATASLLGPLSFVNCMCELSPTLPLSHTSTIHLLWQNPKTQTVVDNNIAASVLLWTCSMNADTLPGWMHSKCGSTHNSDAERDSCKRVFQHDCYHNRTSCLHHHWLATCSYHGTWEIGKVFALQHDSCPTSLVLCDLHLTLAWMKLNMTSLQQSCNGLIKTPPGGSIDWWGTFAGWRRCTPRIAQQSTIQVLRFSSCISCLGQYAQIMRKRLSSSSLC